MALANPIDTVDTPAQHPFKGRTVAIVNDLEIEEQWYLYQKARELRQVVAVGGDTSKYRIRKPDMTVYSIFIEDSTRTKESFRNAAEFHGLKVNMFDAQFSSLQKGETITDTIKMLSSYSTGQSIFIVRTKLEGVCTWLQEAITPHAASLGIPQPSFINAGDGRHEHPSQEFLDEFSFLEQLGWDRSRIHLALIGDLFHGRTVHSKVDGLKLYGQVDVDLIAPTELALPHMYEERMVSAGYNVRKFASIEEYLEQPKVAKLWYFTRLQMERMGEKVLSKSAELRKAVTMQPSFVDKLPANTKLFHPLPRDGRHPVLPFWLDKTELNGWDRQSQNGYFTRIVLLGMLGGLFGDDYKAPPKKIGGPTLDSPLAGPVASSVDFVQEIAGLDGDVEGLTPVHNGILVDGLAEGQDVERIWGVLYMVRSVLGLHGIGSQGVVRSPTNPKQCSGFISVPDLDVNTWGRQNLKKLAAMAPGCKLKDIADGNIQREFRFSLPPRIYNFREISCKNEACVSHPKNGQREVVVRFNRIGGRGDASGRFECKYCETPHDFWQIWDLTRCHHVMGFPL